MWLEELNLEMEIKVEFEIELFSQALKIALDLDSSLFVKRKIINYITRSSNAFRLLSEVQASIGPTQAS